MHSKTYRSLLVLNSLLVHIIETFFDIHFNDVIGVSAVNGIPNREKPAVKQLFTIQFYRNAALEVDAIS